MTQIFQDSCQKDSILASILQKKVEEIWIILHDFWSHFCKILNSLTNRKELAWRPTTGHQIEIFAVSGTKQPTWQNTKTTPNIL